MSGTLYTLTKVPLGLWPLGTVAPFTDYTGLKNSGTCSATPNLGLSNADGTKYGTILDTNAVAQFPAKVFKVGAENKPFTLSARVTPITRDTSTPVEQQILGNYGNLDGLTIKGTVISFVTKYTDGSECRASFDIQVPRRLDLFGVHTETKNSLYIDGVVAAETSITQPQQSLSYVSSSTNLFSGTTAGTQGISVNNVAVWNRALNTQDINDVYRAYYRTRRDSTWQKWGGKQININQRPDTIFNIDTQATEDQWNHGQLFNIKIDNDRLTPTYLDNISIPGYWIGTYPLLSYTGGTIWGVNINWRGIGAIMEVSLDGTTWETIYRGENVDTIPPGTDPTGKILLIRATFPGGIVNDTSYLTSVTVTGFKSNVSAMLSARPVTYNFPSDINTEEAVLVRDGLLGVNLNGANLTIGADPTGEPFQPKSIELWYRGSDLTTNFSGTKTYINGNQTQTRRVGEWNCTHITRPTAFPGDLTISGAGQIGRVVLYADELTSTQIDTLYSDYTGTNVLKVSDTTAFGMTESTNAARLSAEDYQVVAAG